jgi:cell division transport system permease protein
LIARLMDFLNRFEAATDRIVPPAGHTAWLTRFTAAVMAFLAVFALALSLAAGRLADRWANALANTATVQVSAPPGQAEAQTRAVLDVLATTPGVIRARALSDAEQRALLAPWFGPDLPVETLPIPRLIEVETDPAGFDSDGLRQRLAGQAPGAVLDDHGRWRAPLVQAAGRLQVLAVVALVLILGAVAAMVTLAASASLAANAQVIRVLRLIGARDAYIARAFVRRFTLRTLTGSFAGATLGLIAVALLPSAEAESGFLTGLGFQGAEWLLPLTLPPVAALIAFVATRTAALGRLKELP